MHQSRASGYDLALVKIERMQARQYTVIGWPSPLEAAGRICRDRGGNRRPYCAEEFVPRSESLRVREGGVEGGDSFDDASVPGMQIGEIEELLGEGC